MKSCGTQIRIGRKKLGKRPSPAGAVVPSHHHNGPHLLVAVSDLDLRSDVEGRAPTLAKFKSGEIKWLPGGYTHTVTNVGKSPARLVTVEF